MTTTNQQRVLVVGRNTSSNLCMARSFGKAGYDVEVLRIFQVRPHPLNLMRFLRPEAHSNYVSAYHTLVCSEQNSRIAQKILSLADPQRKTLLVPTCDMAASAADEYLDQLRPHFLLPSAGGKAGGINRLMDKELQGTLAKKAGLSVPNSCLIQIRNGAFTIPDTVRYPCFTKPNVSKTSDKTRIRKCDNEQQLRSALTTFGKSQDIDILVEDFLEIRQEYVLLGLSTKSGTLCPGFYLKEMDGHNDRRGITLTGVFLPCSQQQALIDNVTQFVSGLEYEGLFDVELIETKDGSWYFVELNLRYGAGGYAATAAGVNLPAMYADYMFFGKPVDLSCQITQLGKRFVSEKILLDEYARDYLTGSQVKALMDSAAIHFIPDPEDPAPYRHFRKFYLFGAMTRILFRLKQRLKG